MRFWDSCATIWDEAQLLNWYGYYSLKISRIHRRNIAFIRALMITWFVMVGILVSENIAAYRVAVSVSKKSSAAKNFVNFGVSAARGSDGRIERPRAKLCSFFLMTVLDHVNQQPIKQLNDDFGLPLKKIILIARATLKTRWLTHRLTHIHRRGHVCVSICTCACNQLSQHNTVEPWEIM